MPASPLLRSLSGIMATFLLIGLCPHVASAEPKSKYHRATIHPSIVNLNPGGTQSFKIVMVATRLMGAQAPEEVNWAVNDIPGGNARVGTIDAKGLYTAPATMPSPREIHICADVPEAANRYLFATVIIGDGSPQYRSVHIWSEPVVKGTDGTAHLSDPHGIGIDKAGALMIADQEGNKVLRYTPEGKFLGELGKGQGSGPGEFNMPREVKTHSQTGNIYATDSKGDRPRVQVFTHEGEFLYMFAEKGLHAGMILRCHGMDFDSAGRLYTVDVDNMRVNVYTADGEFLYEWGEEGVLPGQFNAPHGLFVDRSDDVFSTGYYGPTQKFNQEGDFVTAFGYGDPPDGAIYFHSVTGDKWGNAYATVRTRAGYQGALTSGDAKRLSIVKFNNNGDFITSWGFTASEHRESSAAVADDGRVFALFEGANEMGVETFVEE